MLREKLKTGAVCTPQNEVSRKLKSGRALSLFSARLTAMLDKLPSIVSGDELQGLNAFIWALIAFHGLALTYWLMSCLRDVTKEPKSKRY